MHMPKTSVAQERLKTHNQITAVIIN